MNRAESFNVLRPTPTLLVSILLALAGCSESATSDSPVLQTFGRTGLGPGELSYPRAAALVPGGDLYVVDKSGRIVRFGKSGEARSEWFMPEYKAGKPTGLGIAADGRVFAADTHYARVSVFSPDGTLLNTFGEWGDGPGQFRLPTDVAVSRDGSIYVSEYGGNDRISKFTSDWTYLFSFGCRNDPEAQTERPQSLLIDDDGSVWVADSCNHRILHFTADGKFLGKFGQVGSGAGDLRFPYSIDRLADGTLVVSEYGNNRIQRFNMAGLSLGTWGTAGRRPGEVANPWAAVTGGEARVYVIDSGNNRVQVFDGLRPESWRPPS